MVLKWNLVFPIGKFKIKNKKNGLFLSTVGGKLKFTETEGTNSDWFVQDSNEAWGIIVSNTGKVLDLYVSQCGIDGCPVGLYFIHGFYNQKWRRSGDKIVSAFPGYLAQDDSGNLFAIESPSDGNKHWTRLEIGNILNTIWWFTYLVFRKYPPAPFNHNNWYSNLTSVSSPEPNGLSRGVCDHKICHS